MEHAQLASQLLKVLRGQRSQVALGRRLGYRANVAYVWESGRRFPPAQVLFRLGALNRASPDRIGRFADPGSRAWPVLAEWDAAHTAAFLKAIAGDATLVDVAAAVGVDRTTVARWLRGATEPRVPELLRFVDAMTHRLVEFVALFADPERLRMLRTVARQLSAQRRMAYELPWSHAVLRALELDAYRAAASPTPDFVASAIGIERPLETQLLSELKAAKIIQKKRGKWSVSRTLTVDTSADPERDRRLKAHWAAVGLERLQNAHGPTDAFHSYNLFSVSHADFARIRDLHLEYYERVRRIVGDSKVADRVVLLNQQLVPLDGQPLAKLHERARKTPRNARRGR
jgi:DNA-binding phage protein